MKYPTIRLRPRTIHFGSNSVTITDSQTGKYKIPYKEIVLVFIRIYDHETGDYQEPELTDITSDMEGDLILCDAEHCRWEIETELSGRTAGALLEELCIHAPFAVAGGQSWFDQENEGEFEEVREMVSLMRACERAR